MLEERKVVSVLFCDLVGFTASSDAADPEDVRARIRPYHARLRQEVERFGGTVEKFVGDAVMAVFGAPVAHEDDAERAVRAALAILAAIEELNESDPGLALSVRVGVNTGEAVVALGAQPELGESLVTGDVVNTANRIESAAPAGGVAVGDQTYRTTSHIFEYAALEPVHAKGKSEPLALWRATAVRIRYGDVYEHTTPFVGRELEKPLLIGIYERTLQRRTVQLVTIVGEPGVGKSRMVAELFAYVEAAPLPQITRWRQGRCLPYGEGITFWALGEIVKREAAILETDSAEVAAGKLEAAVSPDEPDRQWLIQRLAPLIGLEAAPAGRQESFTAWRRYLEGLAAWRETVLVFEDLHWADDALLAFLEHLAEWSDDVPLLILCTARPELFERRPGWGAGQRNAHTINLSPLSDDETAELVAALAAQSLLRPELTQQVLERAGGNPLYAEEFVRLLADRGFDGEIALPESVQALIAARLDTLTPERKTLLQDAAVVGKVFWRSVLAEMGGLDAQDVELALHDLARKELVRPVRTSSMEGEAEYAFWHLLVRDVAYAQIPRAERARRHRAAAAWIERKGGERVEDLAEVLAHHYLLALELAEVAGDTAQVEEVTPAARRFLALAGERALGLDTAQAEQRLARALALTPSDAPDRPQLLVRWADAVAQAGRQRDAVIALDEALATLRTHGDRRPIAAALQLRSRVSLVGGEGRHVPLASEAASLLEQDGPSPELAAAYAQLANANAIAGRHAEAIAAADRAETISSSLGLPSPARAIGYRGYARVYSGDRAGLDEMEWARDQLIAAGAGRDVAVAHNNLAIARYFFEGPAGSLATFEEGLAFCHERGLVEGVVLLSANMPGLLIELGRMDDALEQSRAIAARYDVLGSIQIGSVEVHAAELLARAARGEEPLRESAEELLAVVRRMGNADLAPYALGAAAAAFTLDALERVEAVLTELERIAGASGSPYYARCLPELVRSALVAGLREPAERLVSGLTSRYPLTEHAICAARAALAEDAGERDEAARLYGDAAARWSTFGNVPERAHALLGRGRCLRTLGLPDAVQPLLEAREVFASLGYAPALAEVDALLGPLVAAS
jgi:class 3 adenylate cyclase/tetratricopeptide (TPR) repeat protein